MPRNAKEKMLSADLDSKLVDKFLKQVEKLGFKKKRALHGAVQLWISLPMVVQALILANEYGEKPLEDIIKYIYRNPIDDLRKKLKQPKKKSR